MDPVNKDVKEAVLEADKFLSVTLAQEKLSPAVEKQRSLLAEKFKNLKTQFGCQNDLPGGGKAPPRPPKGGMAVSAPVTSEDQEGGPEELYDDVAGVIADDQSPENAGSAEELNYEIMSDGETPSTAAPQGDGAGEDYMAMDNDTEPQENYEEPQQNEQDKQASVVQEEEYEMPGADATDDYEVADQPSSADSAPTETDSMYEGVEIGDGNVAANSSVDGVPMAGKERSGTVLENLTKSTKPDNIEGVIKKGTLYKHRKEGKVYIGSKYQKRYCVVRNHVFYYFKEKKSSRQQGYILLTGYQVALANKKGREFTLTHPEGHRSFQFESNTKKETEEWMKAIQAAADAPLSENHNLEELRNKQPSDDECSLHYERSGMEEPEDAGQDDNDVYDDTNEDLYEEVGSVQPATPSQQSSPPIQYEIGAVASPPKPAEPSTVELIADEDYEVAEKSPAPAPPPLRPPKSQPPQPMGDVPPAVPPPRPTKPQPPTTPMPIQDELYEEADTPGDADLPPPPALVEDVELENYEELDTFQAQVPSPAPVPAPAPAPVPTPAPATAPAPVPARPPKRKASPPSKPAVPTKPHAARDEDGTSQNCDVFTEKIVCHCGRKIKSRSGSACKTEEGKRARCPCARSGRLCTAECRCRFLCMNTQGELKARESNGCRCGEEKYKRTKDLEFVSCIDVEGKRMTKCPCYSGGRACHERCRCFNCKNSFGATDRPYRIPTPKRSGPQEPKMVGCRCGESGKHKDPWFMACVDVQGKRAIKSTRCPCFKAGVECNKYCKCYNCKNRFSDSDGIPLPKKFCTVATAASNAKEYSDVDVNAWLS